MATSNIVKTPNGVSENPAKFPSETNFGKFPNRNVILRTLFVPGILHRCRGRATMATIDSRSVRTDTDQPDVRRTLLFATYVGQLLVTIAAATGLALLLAGFTTGLGQFVLLAGSWLAVVSASPELAKRGTARLVELEMAHRAPRSARAIGAAVTYVLAR